jgi:hypothetical protein
VNFDSVAHYFKKAAGFGVTNDNMNVEDDQTDEKRLAKSLRKSGNHSQRLHKL